MADKDNSLNPDFESGMLAGFAVSGEITPVTVPDLPVKTRVRVPRGVPGASPVWTGYVASVPIRAADGLWYVAVMLYGGVELHPVDNLVRC